MVSWCSNGRLVLAERQAQHPAMAIGGSKGTREHPAFHTGRAASGSGEPSMVVLPVLGVTQASTSPPKGDKPQWASCCCMWMPSESMAQLP